MIPILVNEAYPRANNQLNMFHIQTAGVGRGIVINTADRTIMGRIANLTSNIDNQQTNMSREMNNFVNIIIYASIVMGIILLAALLGIGYSWITTFVLLIGIILGNVPEGLLTTVTVRSSYSLHFCIFYAFIDTIDTINKLIIIFQV